MFAQVPKCWDEEVEGDRLVGNQSLWTAMHYGLHLVQLEFHIGVNIDNTTPERVRLTTQFRHWMRMEGSYIFSACWNHTFIYGVMHPASKIRVYVPTMVASKVY